MEYARLIWLLCLAGLGISLWQFFRRPKDRRGLWAFIMLLMYGGFAGGVIIASGWSNAQEVNLLIPLLVLNLTLAFAGGLWLLAGAVRRNIKLLSVLLLAGALALSWFNIGMMEGQDWDIGVWLDKIESWFSPNDDGGPAEGELQVHFIDVGQGDAILIRAPEANILIDGGSRGQGPDLVEYIRNQGIERLDFVIATHPHEDHIGGLLAVLTELTVDEVWDPGIVHTSQTFQDYLTLIDEKDIGFVEARAGMSPVGLGGGAILSVLHPNNPSSAHLNDASIVVRLSFGSTSWLFTGDAEAGAEAEMLVGRQRLDSTVLKAGHHGSTTSTTPEFFQAVAPRYAVITVGTGNRYSHPRQEILDMFRDADVEVYRTDLHGTVVMTSDGDTIRITTKNSAPEADIFRAPAQ